MDVTGGYMKAWRPPLVRSYRKLSPPRRSTIVKHSVGPRRPACPWRIRLSLMTMPKIGGAAMPGSMRGGQAPVTDARPLVRRDDYPSYQHHRHLPADPSS